jgi:hypothetical protein
VDPGLWVQSGGHRVHRGHVRPHRARHHDRHRTRVQKNVRLEKYKFNIYFGYKNNRVTNISIAILKFPQTLSGFEPVKAKTLRETMGQFKHPLMAEGGGWKLEG